MTQLFLAYLVFLGALASPGPDFLIVLRNALGYSARAGVFTAAGIAAALTVHFAYCIAGIGLLITQSVLLFNAIKWMGAAYLVYIGIDALRSKGTTVETMGVPASSAAAIMTDMRAFKNGFITNLFNPKATMFFLALFSQMIDPAMDKGILVLFCAFCMATAFIWFSLVATIMGVPAIRQGYAKASLWLDRVFGAFFIGLGAKLAFARQ
jgi:RhtB (resistance to homoserine/threonine) family protein